MNRPKDFDGWWEEKVKEHNGNLDNCCFKYLIEEAWEASKKFHYPEDDGR